MQRRALKIEYDGSDFFGWQLQPHVRTVQGELESAIALATGEENRVVLHGAGRTDAGVHALAQVAHFDSGSPHDPGTFMKAINYWLADDVSVRTVRNTGPEFHARFSAERKTYRYCIIISESKRPLSERYCLRRRSMPDVEKMNACARLIIGKHDFAAFTASGSDNEHTEKTIFRCEWIQDGDLLHYVVEGDGFTYNMVRNLVGSMLEIGGGSAGPEEFLRVMRSGERVLAGPTAPAGGLTLVAVKYPEDLDPFRR